jgi:hypothetical protein
LSGINNDSGLSGSTGWHNSVRSRLFFKMYDDDEADSDLRQLEVKKNNYGPSGEVVRMVWRDGVFVPLTMPSSVDQTIAERRVEIVSSVCSTSTRSKTSNSARIRHPGTTTPRPCSPSARMREPASALSNRRCSG